MRVLTVVTLLLAILLAGYNYKSLSSKNCGDNDSEPFSLVIIKGRVTVLDDPEDGVMPYSHGTVTFQKVGCPSCYVAAKTDEEGNYEIMVGRGKYKVIIEKPTPPVSVEGEPTSDTDLLAPGQERYIDTDTLEAKKYSKSVFNFDIKLTFSKK